MSFRGVGVDTDFVAEQQTLDGHFVGGKGGASGLGDLTREQVKAMAMRERKQFAGFVMMLSVFIFLSAYVLNDLTGFGALINIPGL